MPGRGRWRGARPICWCGDDSSAGEDDPVAGPAHWRAAGARLLEAAALRAFWGGAGLSRLRAFSVWLTLAGSSVRVAVMVEGAGGGLVEPAFEFLGGDQAAAAAVDNSEFG